ncbi:MAG TPA: DMT family transporter [Bacteroidales bacterium]|nr:DMT family transporter [Bacteroidales bacterium]HOS72408.1 DMT family transporter [Bacteroidales bacterium]HQH23871.1 DMT family transporter [Bacteroidales bacterium]HQJ81201.1 DMT family transporter [Bacteroidales bacterium]
MGNKDNTIFLAIIACLLWSTVYAGIKIGLQYDSALHFAGLRFIISGLMIFPFTVKPGLFIKTLRENRKIVIWVTFLQTLVNYILFYIGLDLVPGALGAVIVGSQPLVTAVVAAVMSKEEKLTRRKIVTVFSGIAGVVFISAGRQAFHLGSAVEMLGVVMILGANIATAVSNVMVSFKSRGLNPLILSSTSLFSGGIIIFLLSIPLEGLPDYSNMPLQYWLILIWLGFVSAFAFSLWYKLLQRPHVKVSEINMWKFIIPVAGAILSWVLVPGEVPEFLTVAGMVIITLSLLLFYKNENGYLIRLK